MLIYFFIFIIGLCIGSFLNVVVYRLPEKKSIWKERSQCPHCHQKIKGYDLIPLLSFLLLKAKCRNCKQKVSWQYPIVELVTGLLFLFTAIFHQVNLDFANPFFYRDLIFIAGLVIIFTTDLRYYLIFDAVTIPLIIFAFFVNFFLLSNSANYLTVVINLLIAALIAGGFFLFQFLVSKGKWICGWDIRLGVLMGFMLGWPNIILALILAYIIGAVFSLLLIAVKRKKMKSHMPFGVFLSLATVMSLFFAEPIINWYLNLLGI